LRAARVAGGGIGLGDPRAARSRDRADRDAQGRLGRERARRIWRRTPRYTAALLYGVGMRSGVLRGREHLLLGAVAALAERRVAIALSRGGASKNYSHRDPNEDACAFAWTDHAWLIAVADGHWGAGGAELALDRLLERHAPRWTSSNPIALADRWPLEAP